MSAELQEFTPESLQLRELAPKAMPGEPPRRWFASARGDLIVWLGTDGTPDGFQFCYDKDYVEHALTWMPACGFSHMRVDKGPSDREAPLLVPDGNIDAGRILALFRGQSGLVPVEYIDLVSQRLRELGQALSPP